ncbi:MAG TPA: cyclic pyranopterin monophosphate synthase MoaC [Candidatus Thermoplasmatota archaeon]|nr:cyclic pyranopterin monophosphate synthase MoaC [Candidatus Thermoplasmatota archaeon]
MTARMVDVGDKDLVARRAVAEGVLRLSARTVQAIRRGTIEKGDVVATATVAGLQAVKRTPETLPLCHPIPLTSAHVTLRLEKDRVVARCEVAAEYRTGVEMEALTGAAAALLCVWDMVKPLEKDARGQYPRTRIESLRVLEKRKGQSPRRRRA